jgi:hypothetical protein
MTNPQTWNRHAFVTNNPLSYTDPLGLNRCGPSCGCNMDVYNCFGGGGVGDGGGFLSGGYGSDGFLIGTDIYGTITVGAPGDYSQEWGVIGTSYEYFSPGGSDWTSDPTGGDGPSTGGGGNCTITVKCRGIQANSLGKLGFQHCDAGVTDSNGNQHALSAGPDPPNQPTNPNTVLNAWDTTLVPSQFTGNTTFTSTSCPLAACLINSTDQWNASPVKPLYGYLDFRLGACRAKRRKQ